MYQLLCHELPMLDLRDERLVVRNPSVHLAVGEAGEVAFTIDNDHPYYAFPSLLSDLVRLQADDVTIFKGRIVKDTTEFNLSRRIEAEGLLACLNDSIIPPFVFPDDFLEDHAYQEAAESGNVIRFFLGWLLDQHNSQVGEMQQIQLGDVTVTDPNNYIARSSSEYLTTMEVVREKLEDLLGGYLLADYSGEGTKLHYYSDLPLMNSQTVEFGENLLNLVSEQDSTDTFTAILPLGKDGLTIEALDDGEISTGIIKEGRIIYSQTLEESLGGVRIVRKVEWDDVTEAANLRAKAAARLSAEGAVTAQTLTVKALDLGGTYTNTLASGTAAIAGTALAGQAIVGTSAVSSNGYSRFVVGQYVRLVSAPHGLDISLPLLELEPNILNPGRTEIVLGKHWRR